MSQSQPIATFQRTPDRSARTVRTFRLQMYGAIAFGIAIWLLGFVLDRGLGSGFFSLLCALPMVLICVRAFWELRTRLNETLEIHSDGIYLTNTMRLKSYFAWDEVDTHRDPVFSSAADELAATGVGLLEPLYPYYLRENGWGEPTAVATAVHAAQLSHYLPTLLAQYENEEVLWFGQFGLSKQGIHRAARRGEAEAVVYWHTVEGLHAAPPLLDWQKIKIGQIGTRRTQRVQRPYVIQVALSFAGPFAEIELFHQTLLFLQVCESIGQPVTLTTT